MSDKSSEKSEMSALAEASMLVRDLAEPGRPGETVKAALQRACRHLTGWPPSRVRDLWYADPRISVSADEMNRLRAAARREREEEQEARDELQSIKATLARIEALLLADANPFRAVAAQGQPPDGQAYRPLDR